MRPSDERSSAAVALGVWSARLTAGSTMAFTVAAVLTETGRLSPPWNAVLPLAPSLLLAPSFLAMLICVNAVVPRHLKVWSQLGVAFALVYVPLCSAAYVVELFVVEPRVLRGTAGETALLTIARGDSVFNAIDGLGYIFMSLAALVAAPAFGGNRLERWIRGLLVAHGAVALPIFLTYFVSRTFIYGAALWSVTLSASALLMAAFFTRVAGETVGQSPSVSARSGPCSSTAADPQPEQR